jgi:hypothetical protein
MKNVRKERKKERKKEKRKKERKECSCKERNGETNEK